MRRTVDVSMYNVQMVIINKRRQNPKKETTFYTKIRSKILCINW